MPASTRSSRSVIRWSITTQPGGQRCRVAALAALCAPVSAQPYPVSFNVCSSTTHVCIHPRRADNAVNGVPSCANSEFLNGVLRDQYGFDGLVVSDCGAIDHIHSQFKPGDPSTTGGNNQSGVMKPGFPANSSDATMLAVRKPLFPLQCAAQCRNVWPRSAMLCQNKMISTNCAREMCS